MSEARENGDNFFTNLQFKKALIEYLKAQKIFFNEGKVKEKSHVEFKIAQCLALLGLKEEALQILSDLYLSSKEQLNFKECIKIEVEIAFTYMLYGKYIQSQEWLGKIDEKDIENIEPPIYFRYWQNVIQIFIVQHKFKEAKRKLERLIDKAKNINNEVFYHELLVLLAQIEAEEGNVVDAYKQINNALNYFKSTPFERSAFEKKIILSQFTDEPEETLELIDEYSARYNPEDVQSLALNSYRIELELRTGKISLYESITKAERLLHISKSIGHSDIAARISRLLSGLYQSINEEQKAYDSFLEAKRYFSSQELEYEEAMTMFVYLPAYIKSSTIISDIITNYMPSYKKLLNEKEKQELSAETDSLVTNEKVSVESNEDEIITIKKKYGLLGYPLPYESDILKTVKIFEKYGDEVKAKMSLFFYLSLLINIVPIFSLSADIDEIVKSMTQIQKWMEEKGELQYSEMITHFLYFLNRSLK